MSRGAGRARRRGPSALAHRNPVSLQDLGGLINGVFMSQCSSPVFLSITVVDQPDLDPQFVREFYSASVAEDAAVVRVGDLEAPGETTGRGKGQRR